ncbi:MAG: hypothetical protein KJ650_00810 [Firmicutes bacterium]|nr:hypothetical protein [Bacillota bacterium]MBV1727311.1 hypothetical protein [Desulforudis sp.]MBV1736416.1 hypothetical protein [Desulforudis sp.]
MDRWLDDIDSETIRHMVDHYLEKVTTGRYTAKNICITHFNNAGVKKVNFYEAAY